MDELAAWHARLCREASDINEHLETLRRFADECAVVSELGTGPACSTVAFLASTAGRVTSCDHGRHRPSLVRDRVARLRRLARARFTFILADSREDRAVPEPCDFLFIDTFHNARHVLAELETHGHKARRFIGFHDVSTFGDRGDDGAAGLLHGIRAYRAGRPGVWRPGIVRRNNNGLVILRRAG